VVMLGHKKPQGAHMGGKLARIGLIGFDLFRLDIDHIILVIKLAHLT
jgi:hypothetical protein